MCLDFFSALMLILILLSSAYEKSKTPLLRIYSGMAASCACALLLEAVSILVSFFAPPGTELLRTLLNNLAIVGGYGLSYCYACYVANLVGPERGLCQRTLKALRILSAVAAILLFIGGAFGLFFTFEDGATTPGQFFVLLFGFDILACVAGIALIIVYAKSLNTRDMVALLTLPAFIFLSATLQYLSFRMMYGLFFMAAVSLFVIYLMIQTERNQQRVAQEKQLMDMNIAVMRSQIQPHFLYNALSSIRRMIKKDPEVAAIAVENFAAYLRQNLESMNRVEPIPFTSELEHLQEYLYLEKLRFGDRLHIEYEIGYSDFVLPVLSLQPIVENAVKHGILKRDEGGWVRIQTCREGANVRLTVTDNGVGYVPGAVLQDGRTHIGFENVKRRIELQCKGTVHVDSVPGTGTTVTVTLPLL